MVRSYSGTTSSGTLTVSDAQHDTASIKLVGNYLNSTFSLFSDGKGGTLVVDPPVAPAPTDDISPANEQASASSAPIGVSLHGVAVRDAGAFVAALMNAGQGQDLFASDSNVAAPFVMRPAAVIISETPSVD